MSFNQELVAKVITYFNKKYGIVLSYEKAEEYLNSLASLYESFIEFAKFDE